MTKSEQIKKAGRLQKGCLIVFLFAVPVGGIALIEGNYITVFVSVFLMITNLAIYQWNNNIIKRLSTGPNP